VARSGPLAPNTRVALRLPKIKACRAFQWWRAFQAGIPLLPAAKLMSAKLGEFSFACERCRYHGGGPGAHAQVVDTSSTRSPAQRPFSLPEFIRAVAAMSRTRTWSFQVNSARRTAIRLLAQRQYHNAKNNKERVACQSLNAYLAGLLLTIPAEARSRCPPGEYWRPTQQRCSSKKDVVAP
jgi:hypothetical protein